MRFFVAACVLGLAAGFSGCAAANWPEPKFPWNRQAEGKATGDEKALAPGPAAWGLDPRAQDVERHLGIE